MPLLIAVAGVVALIASLLVSSAGSDARREIATGGGPSAAVRRAQAQVTVLPEVDRLAIPANFLGFSTEYWTVSIDERHASLYRRVLGLVHVPGAGPLVLRIGGNSSDHAFWDPTGRGLPHWAFRLSPAWIAQTARLARDDHLRVIIDLNLVTGTPRVDARWAQEAEEEFPPRSIAGFEIGNEPDIYDRARWSLKVGGPDFGLGVLPRAITPATYAAEYRQFARVLEGVAPGVPLFGPALAQPKRHRRWISALLAGPHPRLAGITVHIYPYSACARLHSIGHPTVAKLLSARSTERIYRAVAPAARLAHASGQPLRVTEFNSVTCSGLDGVSNTFATALWAPRALFTLARAGAASASLHIHQSSVNAPFAFGRGGVSVRPLLYGLIVFARMLGPNSRLVGTHVSAVRGSELTAWAVKHSRRSVSLLLLNDGSRSLRVRIRVPRATGTATVERLLAPSAWSRGHVTIDGQSLDSHAQWTGRRVVEEVRVEHATTAVFVRHTSGALVTFALGPQSRNRRLR